MSKLYQHSTIGALMSELFEGSLTISDLLNQGDLGIGTLDSLDGELIILDGKAYQIKGDGTVHRVDGNEKTPYAAVTDFKAEHSLKVDKKVSSDRLKDKLTRSFTSENTFQAIKVTGSFKNISCRSVMKQNKPYPKLVEVTRSQSEFKRPFVSGSLVGFFTPDIFGTIAVPQFHLHFMSDEKDFGGHVLDFEMIHGKAEWQTIGTLEQHFPVTNDRFMKSDIDYSSLNEDIKEAE